MSDEENVYEEEDRKKSVRNGALTPEEAAFMKGYDEDKEDVWEE